MNSIQNARIKATSLGIERGMLIATLALRGDDWGVVYQAILDEWSEEDGRRIGVPFTSEAIRGVLETLEHERWEDLPGTYVRAQFANAGYVGDTVIAIGHIVKDKWLNFHELAEELTAKAGEKGQ